MDDDQRDDTQSSDDQQSNSDDDQGEGQPSSDSSDALPPGQSAGVGDLPPGIRRGPTTPSTTAEGQGTVRLQQTITPRGLSIDVSPEDAAQAAARESNEPAALMDDLARQDVTVKPPPAEATASGISPKLIVTELRAADPHTIFADAYDHIVEVRRLAEQLSSESEPGPSLIEMLVVLLDETKRFAAIRIGLEEPIGEAEAQLLAGYVRTLDELARRFEAQKESEFKQMAAAITQILIALLPGLFGSSD